MRRNVLRLPGNSPYMARFAAFLVQGSFFANTPWLLRRAGEEIAHCPSCSLYVKVIYDPEDFSDAALGDAGSEPGIVAA